MALRLLVADDNRDHANTLARLLQGDGFEVEVAFDGEEALEKASSFQPDVLILDIGMPVMDGLQLAKRLRAMPEFANKVLIALTGLSGQNDLDQASRAEYDEYLLKPVKLDTLRAILAEASHRLSP